MDVKMKIGIVIIPWEVLVLVLLWEFNTNSIGIASFGIVIIPWEDRDGSGWERRQGSLGWPLSGR